MLSQFCRQGNCDIDYLGFHVFAMAVTKEEVIKQLFETRLSYKDMVVLLEHRGFALSIRQLKRILKQTIKPGFPDETITVTLAKLLIMWNVK